MKLWVVGFVKEVGFKPGVKDRGSYRCTEWWIRRGSDGWRNESEMEELKRLNMAS